MHFHHQGMSLMTTQFQRITFQVGVSLEYSLDNFHPCFFAAFHSVCEHKNKLHPVLTLFYISSVVI